MRRKASGPCQSCGDVKYVGDGRYCESCKTGKAKKAATSARNWATRIEKTYEITDAEYFAILESQNGVCYVCHKRPAKRRLAVEHDHALELEVGSRASIRMLACRNCNEYIAHIRDDPAAAIRLHDALVIHPAQEVLRGLHT